MDSTDPDVQAANELNAIFGRMEVPCEVLVSEAEGKHMRATNAINAGEVLFDEVPMASWPSPLFAALPNAMMAEKEKDKKEVEDSGADTGVICFFCLRRREPVAAAEEKEEKASSNGGEQRDGDQDDDDDEELFWLQCEECKVYTCSDACRESWSASSLHGLLCGPARERLIQAQKETAPRTRAEQEDQMLQGITLEALARCAAWLVSRIGQTLRQAQLPVSAFIPSSSPGGDEEEISALQHQIFSVASAPFNRLLAAPDSTEYKGIKVSVWKKAVREALLSTAPDFLNSCAVSDEEDGEDKTTKETNDPTWCAPLLEAALSDDTLQTMLGQLALNSHAINTVLLSPSQPSKSTTGAAAVPDFRVVVKGAGLYSLLSNFNHSCEPNLAVSHPNGTHELEVKAIRDIEEGEPLTISYIPLESRKTEEEWANLPAKQRQELLRDELRERRRELKQYFFECKCPRCLREEELLRS